MKPTPGSGDVLRARLAALVDDVPQEASAAVNPALPVTGRSEPPDASPSVGPRRLVPGASPTEEAWRGRAWEFGRAHVTVIAVIGLIGLVACVWSLTQARTVPVAVAASPEASAVQHPVTSVASSSATPSPTPRVRVHVGGAVFTPGVVELPVGARVQDAVGAAGGFIRDARPGELNLAQVVPDGAQVWVGDAREPGGEVRVPAAGGPAGAQPPASGAAAGGKLNLNQATAQQLETLPGVGPATAQAIVAWRDEHQRFSTVEELQEVDGIGAKTYAKLAPLVSV